MIELLLPLLPTYLLFFGSFLFLLVGFSFSFKKQNIARGIFLIAGFAQFVWGIYILMAQQFYYIQSISQNLSLFVDILSLSVFLIPVFLYHFSLEFCRIRGQRIVLILAYLLSSLLTIFMGARILSEYGMVLNLPILDILNYIYSGFIIFVIFLFFSTLQNFNRGYFCKHKEKVERTKSFTFILVSFGIYGLVFVYFLPINFINIFPFLFLIIPVYVLIFGHHGMEKNIKIVNLTTNTIIVATLILLASLLVFPALELNLLVRSIIFILISFISFLLLRYMDRLDNQNMEFEREMENRTKELQEKTWRLDEVNEELEESNTVLEITVRARTKELKELNENLEMKIQQRTKELNEKTKELEEKIEELKQFSNIFINREAKMVELKERIQELEKRLKEK